MDEPPVLRSVEDGSAEPLREERNFRLALIGVLAVGLFLRVVHLDSSSYTLDEMLQTYFVQGTSDFFWGAIRFDAVHPPLDYLVTRALESLHPADWVRKLPAVAWGVGTIAVVAVLVRRRAGVSAGILTALFLALAPFHVRYSQELRPYSLGLFLLCLSLLYLDLFVRRSRWSTLLGLYVAALATAYTLYFAGLAFGIAGLALLVDESFAPDPERRRRARKALVFSPLFGLALFLAYIPWLPVVLTAAHRPPFAEAPPLTWERLARLVSFFAFAPSDGEPLGRKGPVYVALVGIGVLIAFRRRELRFLAVWLLVGCGAIELLEHLHPHWYSSRHFLTAGIVCPVLAAVTLTTLGKIRQTRVLAALLVVIVLIFDLRSLAVYYRVGRADYRTLGRYLKARPKTERIFTENWFMALCVAFYVVGPEYLFRRGHTTPEIVTLEGKALPLAWSWKPGTTAWLVLAGGDQKVGELREWSKFFPGLVFPRAEGAIVRRLDPSLWQRMITTVPGAKSDGR